MTFEQFKDLLLIVLPPLSVLAGVFVAEFLATRRNSQQMLVKEVMQKKLSLYEDLYEKVLGYHGIATEYFESATSAKSKEEIQKIANEPYIAGLKIAEFTDANKLFLDEEVIIHIMLTVLGPSEIVELNPKEKSFHKNVKVISSKFYSDYSEAIDLIDDYSGIARLRKSLGKINKPKGSSDYIEYMKEVKEKYKSRT